MLVKNINNTK